MIWDWARWSQRAFELPLAATAWLFGLQQVSNDRYLAWSLVIGVALLAAYAALSALVFTGLADRVFGVTGLPASPCRRLRLGGRQLHLLLGHAAADRP